MNDAEEPTSVRARPPARDERGLWKHVFAVAWLTAIAVVVLAPDLTHGSSFGSFDYLSQLGVLQQHGVVAHNFQAGDQADSTIPWVTLAWTQVHHGHLPLWNPYAALGVPLTFNWQAASFSLPTLIGYVFPEHLDSTVQVFLTLIIAGTGAYALGRVLRLGLLGCLFGATVFELSGPLLGWLGWIHAAAMSWAGWLFVGAILILRGGSGRRVRCIALFALVLAALIYSGSPEVTVLLGLSLAIFVVVEVALRTRFLKGSGPIRRPLVDLVLAVVAGCALAAPLLLPGVQLISISQRGVTGGDPAELLPGNPPLPPHNLLHLIFQGFDGLPIAGSRWFGYTLGYSETAAYVGVIALVLAVTGVAMRRRRPEVVAFSVLTVAMVCIAFVPPVVAVLSRLPGVGSTLWQRALLPLAFALAILSAFGMDSLVRAADRQRLLRWVGGGFGVAGVLLLALWAFGRGHLPPSEASIRTSSFLWPAVETALGLGVFVVLTLVYRTQRSEKRQLRSDVRRWAALSLLVCETAFLVTAGFPVLTASATFFPVTPAEVAFQRSVGQSTVGFGAPLCFYPPGLGIPPNAQLAYGVTELSIYDPMIPNAYFTSWRNLTHQAAGNADDSAYCPVVTTTAQARLYGVSFVLERAGTPGPRGSVFDKKIGDEALYRIPAAASATISPLSVTGKLPGIHAHGMPVPVTHPDPASWELVTHASSRQVLRLRLTDVPGWHASIDGRGVPLQRFAGVMLQVEVPPGRHTVKLYYWPATFTVGIVLAGCALFGLVAALVIERIRRRPREAPSL